MYSWVDAETYYETTAPRDRSYRETEEVVEPQMPQGGRITRGIGVKLRCTLRTSPAAMGLARVQYRRAFSQLCFEVWWQLRATDEVHARKWCTWCEATHLTTTHLQDEARCWFEGVAELASPSHGNSYRTGTWTNVETIVNHRGNDSSKVTDAKGHATEQTYSQTQTKLTKHIGTWIHRCTYT